MHRASRYLVTILVALTILFVAPHSAGARGPGAPQPNLRTAESWVDAALGWLQDVLTPRRPARHQHTSGAPGGIQTKDATGGSCIDPQGNPKPWCL